MKEQLRKLNANEGSHAKLVTENNKRQITRHGNYLNNGDEQTEAHDMHNVRNIGDYQMLSNMIKQNIENNKSGKERTKSEQKKANFYRNDQLDWHEVDDLDALNQQLDQCDEQDPGVIGNIDLNIEEDVFFVSLIKPKACTRKGKLWQYSEQATCLSGQKQEERT